MQRLIGRRHVNRKSSRTEPPHWNVYVRLKASPLDGVGVFAIRAIPKGTYIFLGDNDELCWIDASQTKRLPKEVRELYEDFCVLRNGRYGCPRTFNLLTPAWYVNHSDDPNLAAHANLDFFATRRIQRGQELTLNYRWQSEAQRRKAFGST